MSFVIFKKIEELDKKRILKLRNYANLYSECLLKFYPDFKSQINGAAVKYDIVNLHAEDLFSWRVLTVSHPLLLMSFLTFSFFRNFLFLCPRQSSYLIWRHSRQQIRPQKVLSYVSIKKKNCFVCKFFLKNKQKVNPKILF